MFSLASSMVMSKNYDAYKKTYKALTTGEYKFSHKDTDEYYYEKSIIVTPSYPSYRKYITYSEITGSIILLSNAYEYKYLGNNFMTKMDPYSLYWLIKFKKWFKKYKGVSDYRLINRDSKIEEILGV
jgi:hypothetical protein